MHDKDINMRLSILIEKTNSLINKNTPVKLIKVSQCKKDSKQWISKGLLKSIATKNILYKNFLRTKNKTVKLERFNEFKKYRNMLTRCLRSGKTNFYRNLFATRKHDLKAVWNGIKEIVGGKNKKDGMPRLFTLKNNQFQTDDTIAEAFNEYFGTIADKTKANIVTANNDFRDYLTNPHEVTFVHSFTTPHEVLDLIQCLDESTSVGPGSFQTVYLKFYSAHK